LSADRFTADDLIDCYRQGVFPMGEAGDDARIYLVEPKLRGIIPLDAFHVSRRLARTVRADAFEVRLDTAFERILDACAAPAPDRPETWINGPIRRLYVELYTRGVAHSVECWRGGELMGGLYGVSLGGAFFGESMVSMARDASKVALVHLVARLHVGGYSLLDVQFLTEHLGSFGAVETPQTRYRTLLRAALRGAGDIYALPPQADGAAALQAISQRS
jgi:leucyl/phenylalanyl-tRNA--protein transferase